MRYILVLALSTLFLAAPLAGQRPEIIKTPEQQSPGSQSKLLKSQHEEIKKLAAELVDMSMDVEHEIGKSGENVLPLATMKKLEEIEKLARKLRNRLKE